MSIAVIWPYGTSTKKTISRLIELRRKSKDKWEITLYLVFGANSQGENQFYCPDFFISILNWENNLFHTNCQFRSFLSMVSLVKMCPIFFYSCQSKLYLFYIYVILKFLHCMDISFCALISKYICHIREDLFTLGLVYNLS